MDSSVWYIIGITVAIYFLKPSIFFKPNGKPRVYGVGIDEEGYKKTLYTFQFALLIIAILFATSASKFVEAS